MVPEPVTPPRSSAARRPLRYWQAAWKCLTSRAYRHALWLRWRRPRNLFQVNNLTAANRYPQLFQRAAELLSERPEPQLVSFGCSTGEEVFSLRQYFPTAVITGIDINRHNIEVCQLRLAEHPDARMRFELGDSVASLAAGSVDAIFCLAVFRNGDLIDSRFQRCDRLIRFAVFAEIMADMERRLSPGGLLVIAHANFRFRDTPTFARFELVGQWSLPGPHAPVTPVFDVNNCRTAEVNYDEVVFRKKV